MFYLLIKISPLPWPEYRALIIYKIPSLYIQWRPYNGRSYFFFSALSKSYGRQQVQAPCPLPPKKIVMQKWLWRKLENLTFQKHSKRKTARPVKLHSNYKICKIIIFQRPFTTSSYYTVDLIY